MSLRDKLTKALDKLTPSGALDKLKITAYSDSNFNDTSKVGTFEVPFNPVALNVKMQIALVEQYEHNQAEGKPAYKGIPSQDFSFEFILDSTGFAGGNALGEITDIGVGSKLENKGDVPAQVEQLVNLVYTYNGKVHQSNYIQILYGSLLVKCVLNTIDISYNLFAKNGKPLRAKINMSFKTTGDPKLNEAIKNKTSPDLTHIRELKQYEHFLTTSYEIYEDNFMFVQVARANKMNRIRENKTGERITFPPVITSETANT